MNCKVLRYEKGLPKQPPQQKKGSKSEKLNRKNAWKDLFPRISAVVRCINFSVTMFLKAQNVGVKTSIQTIPLPRKFLFPTYF